MTLERFGFQTGEVILPGIEMPATLPPGFYFKNYGTVLDLREKTLEIAQELGVGFDCPNNFTERSGTHLGITKRYDIGSAILIKQGHDKPTEIFNYGHESVHAIRNLRLESQFVAFLKREGFRFNPFETYCDEEKIAHVGGLLGLYKSGVLWMFSHPEVDMIKYDLMSSRI